VHEVAAQADVFESHHLDRVLEMLGGPRDRRAVRVDREGMKHQAEDSTALCQRPQLLVVEVARRLVQCPAARV
jgi:hypothetical protein